MDFSDSNLNIWSKIGSRATFGLAALELGKNIDNDFMSIDEFDHMPGLFDISNGKE